MLAHFTQTKYGIVRYGGDYTLAEATDDARQDFIEKHSELRELQSTGQFEELERQIDFYLSEESGYD